MIENQNRILSEDCGLPWNHWTLQQKKTVVALVRATSSLSIIGSAYIIWHIYRNPCKNNRQQQFKSIYHRIMIGLSVSDLVGSFGVFLSTWPKPSENEYTAFDYEAYGTTGTCDAQGFTILFGYLSSIIYYSGLTLYFLLCIKYGWLSENLRKMENLCHLFSCPCAFVMSLICYLNHAFNPSGRFCFVQSYPINCEASDDVECQRGANVNIFRWLVMISIVTGSIIILFCMVSLYLFVRAQEKRVAAYTHSTSERKERKVFNIACWYVTVYIIAYLPPIVQMVMSKQHTCHESAFAVSVISSTFFPIQGLMNAIVFLQFRPIKWLMPSSIFPRSFSFTDVPSMISRRFSRQGSLDQFQNIAAAAEAVRNELESEINEESHDNGSCNIPENSELSAPSSSVLALTNERKVEIVGYSSEQYSKHCIYDVEENSSHSANIHLLTRKGDEDVTVIGCDVSSEDEVIKSA